MPPRRGALATPEWESSLLDVQRHVPQGERIDAMALRIGGGVAALLQSRPAAVYEITLEQPPAVMGGRVPRPQMGDNPPIGVPADIIGVSRRGVPWYSAWLLVPDDAAVVSEDVGGFHHGIVSFNGNHAVRRGCLVDDDTIAYLDDDRPDTVWLRALDSSATPRALALPPQSGGGTGDWGELRFGGSPSGGCVLWGPRFPTAILVAHGELRAIGPFIEKTSSERWYQRLRRTLTRQPSPVDVVDATTFPGGVAVLFAGRTAGARRIVDLYSDSGSYLETLVLPMPSLRIAGYGPRIYALRQNGDSIKLASYVLPSSAIALNR